MIEFRSASDLDLAIVSNLGRFPRDLSLVVGIPRSGMLPATLLALYLDLPLLDLDSYLEGRIPSVGRRLRNCCEGPEAVIASSAGARKVLVVDDSLWSGNALSIAKQRIKEAPNLSDTVLYAVVYIEPTQCKLVDIWLECVGRRVFEWNIMNHSILTCSCVDIDGVLCRDPTDEENDDGERYRVFLETVPALFRPGQKIGWLVTSRLEKYRPQTEEWLRKNKISFEHLVMLDLASKEERMASGCHAEFKAKAFRRTSAVLFIESNEGQAAEIARISCKPVYCVATRQMYYHASVEKLRSLDRLEQAARRTWIWKLLGRLTRPVRLRIRKGYQLMK